MVCEWCAKDLDLEFGRIARGGGERDVERACWGWRVGSSVPWTCEGITVFLLDDWMTSDLTCGRGEKDEENVNGVLEWLLRPRTIAPIIVHLSISRVPVKLFFTLVLGNSKASHQMIFEFLLFVMGRDSLVRIWEGRLQTTTVDHSA